MYTSKDVCKICGVKKWKYEHAKNILFPSLPPIGTGNAFQFSENDMDKFQMFFLLSRIDILKAKKFKIIFDKYKTDEMELLHKRVLTLISGLKTLLRKGDLK